MKIHRNIENFPFIEKGTLVTTGTFDGVHVGHQKMLDYMVQKAFSHDLESVLVTFFPHPRSVLGSSTDFSVKMLSSLDEKIELFRQFGVQHLIIHPFTIEFSKVPFTQYVRDYLIKKLNMKYMVVGHDHHVGKNRQGSFENIKELEIMYDFQVERVEAFDINGIDISSTKIRNALENGDVKTAFNYSGRPYAFSAKVIKGDQIGRTLGYPTANLIPIDPDKMIPANGIYAVQVYFKSSLYQGMASIGPRPTFAKMEPVIEVHIFEFDQMIYEEILKIEFIDKVRDIQRFNSSKELVQCLHQDKVKSLQLLSTN